MRSLALFSAFAASASAQNICAGNVDILVNGVVTPMQVSQVGGVDGRVTTSGRSISMTYGPRAYVTSTCSSSGFTPGMYSPGLPLLGRSLTYTVDLSTVSCACNAALYLTYMPAYDANNAPTPTSSNDYYCDANEVSGVYCPEMDVMEANSAAFQVTPHKCASPQGRYFPTCDRGGCGVNSNRVDAQGYGPGGGYTIDSTRAFNVTTVFAAAGGVLLNVTTVLAQAGKTFVMIHTDSNCGAGYLEGLSPSLGSGMTLVLSLWGSTGSGMSWLDVPPCDINTACDTGSAAVTFSNIAINDI